MPATPPAASDERAEARLFIAAWPDPGTFEQLQACSAALPWSPVARPVPTHRLHLTLHFIGAVERSRLADIADRLDVGPARLQLTFDRIEIWKQKIAVLCPSTVPRELAALHAALALRLQATGLTPDERPYSPHVTLARKAAGLRPGYVEPLRWTSSGYALVESRGAYIDLRRYG